jgi:hypothetical protein
MTSTVEQSATVILLSSFQPALQELGVKPKGES